MCNRQLTPPADRGWRDEICGRNTSDQVGGVESPSASCEGGKAHRPKTGLAGSGARHFASDGRGYPTPVSCTRLVRDCFRVQRELTVCTVRVPSRFLSIWV